MTSDGDGPEYTSIRVHKGTPELLAKVRDHFSERGITVSNDQLIRIWAELMCFIIEKNKHIDFEKWYTERHGVTADTPVVMRINQYLKEAVFK